MFDKLTKKELREECLERELSTSGRKSTLVSRLEEYQNPVAEGPIEEDVEEVETVDLEEAEAGAELKVEDEVVEEAKTVVDAMPSEVRDDPWADAKLHYIGPGSVSGSFIFDDVPGQISAQNEEEAFEAHRILPGKLKVPGSH